MKAHKWEDVGPWVVLENDILWWISLGGQPKSVKSAACGGGVRGRA